MKTPTRGNSTVPDTPYVCDACAAPVTDLRRPVPTPTTTLTDVWNLCDDCFDLLEDEDENE